MSSDLRLSVVIRFENVVYYSDIPKLFEILSSVKNLLATVNPTRIPSEVVSSVFLKARAAARKVSTYITLLISKLIKL